MIPTEGYAERPDLVYFPHGTGDLFHFLTEKPADNLMVDVCIEEEDYKEVALHADWVIIGHSSL